MKKLEVKQTGKEIRCYLDDTEKIVVEDDGSNDEPEEDFLATLDTSVDEDYETGELVDAAEAVVEKHYYTNVYIGKWDVRGYGYTGTVKEFKTAMEAYKYLKNKETRYSKKTHWIHEIFVANSLEDFHRQRGKDYSLEHERYSAFRIYEHGTTWYHKEKSTVAEIQALIDVETAKKDAEMAVKRAEMLRRTEIDNAKTTNINEFLIVPDQFAALELVDDYFPNLNISGRLTKSNGVLTAINGDGVQVAIHDDHLLVDNGNGIWRIEYDIAETDFRRTLRNVTRKMIEEGKLQPTFEIVGKSGLIYTYTEATLKPVLTETQIEHDTRVNSAPKLSKPDNNNTTVTVAKLWKLLRQKQQSLKAIMLEKNIAAERKYSVQFAEIKFVVDTINQLTQTFAA